MQSPDEFSLLQEMKFYSLTNKKGEKRIKLIFHFL